ncbi:MAG: thioredoxin family protein [Bacteroidales bacterium]|nr:thioredoxin family protein [Bacteroidales bacterium]
MKKIALILMALALAMPMMAQTKKNTNAGKSGAKTEVKEVQAPLPKVYDEDINAMEQIEQALDIARTTNRKVICQVGGNWCPWCLRFANFITKDDEIAKLIEENFVYIHVNTSKENKNTEAMKFLGNPGRFGYPVFVILDREGRVMQTESSAYLEKDKSYDREKVKAFFANWTDAAIDNLK